MILHTSGNKEVRLQGTKIVAITPDDDNDIEVGKSGCALYCNADMTVAVVLSGESANTGHILKLNKGFQPLLVRRVLSTGTALGGESLFGIV